MVHQIQVIPNVMKTPQPMDERGKWKTTTQPILPKVYTMYTKIPFNNGNKTNIRKSKRSLLIKVFHLYDL
jgi:hypothetical protein